MDSFENGASTTSDAPEMEEASTIVEGQEKENSSSLSPEFIKMAHSLIDDASAEQIQYIMDCCNEESSEGAPDAESSEKPEMYSSDDMPKD